MLLKDKMIRSHQASSMLRAEPTRTVEECASLFSWVAAAAAAVAAASGVGGGDPGATGHNAQLESIPEVLDIGTGGSQWWMAANEDGSYNRDDVSRWINKYDKNGDFELDRAEFNNALQDEGFEIELSKDAWDHFDNGVAGSASYGYFLSEYDGFFNPYMVHDGTLTADELGHMRDDKGDELVVRVDKETGKHILDIADKYKSRAAQDYLDREVKAVKMKAQRRVRYEQREEEWRKEERRKEKQKKDRQDKEGGARSEGSLLGLAVGGGTALAKNYRDKLLKQRRERKEEEGDTPALNKGPPAATKSYNNERRKDQLSFELRF